MSRKSDRLLQRLCSFLLLCAVIPLCAAEGDAPQWDGVWTAEGTLFTIAVTVNDGVMRVEKIETMGFNWNSGDGIVDGNIVMVAVDYAGATGVVRAELLDATTAVASTASCTPEYMVVCALSRGRQARFRKVETD